MSVWTRQCLGCHIWNIPQLVQGRMALTQSVAFLLYRETQTLSLQLPQHQIIVSAAHHPGHNMRPVLELLLFHVSKMLAFFFQWSRLSWEKFQYHVSWFESMTVFVAGETAKTLPTLFEKYCLVEVKFDYMEPLVQVLKPSSRGDVLFPPEEATEACFHCHRVLSRLERKAVGQISRNRLHLGKAAPLPAGWRSSSLSHSWSAALFS